MLKINKPFGIILVFFALCSPCEADETAVGILSGSLKIYEKYLPFDDYIKLCTLRDTVVYMENSDLNMSRHILAVSEKEIWSLHQSGMAKLKERIGRVDRMLSELRRITGAAKAEISTLDKEYAAYKAHIDKHPEADEVMDKIEKLYSQLILRKRYERRTAGTIYVVKKGDCLSRIAEMDTVYGNWRKWRLIFQANKGIMPNPNNPHLIRPGMRLVIPQN